MLAWKKSILLANKGFDERYFDGFEDFDLVARATVKGARIVVIDEVLYEYRRGHSSLSQSWRAKREVELRNLVLENLTKLCSHRLVELLGIIDESPTRMFLSEPSRAAFQTQTGARGRVKSKRISYALRLIRRAKSNRFIREMWEELPPTLRSHIFRKMVN